MDQMVFNITLLKASRYCWEYFFTSRPSTQISLMAKDDDQLIKSSFVNLPGESLEKSAPNQEDQKGEEAE